MKYHDKYRIPSTRLPAWDYGWNAAYFVTLCTKGRICYFGDVIAGNMELSDIGKIANDCWKDIPIHFPFVTLDAYVVMPNHVHGIIIIDKPEKSSVVVETQNLASLPSEPTQNKFGPQSKNLGSIIRGFKIGVTKNARLINPDFTWQARYFDHIIRNEKSWQNISGYIFNNPAKWQNDEYFLKG